MKRAEWQQCSEVTITSEMANLEEVAANLLELHTLKIEDVRTCGQISLAVWFLHEAIQSLARSIATKDTQT